MPRRTFLDSGVLINAFRGETAQRERCMQIIDDPNRLFLANDFLRLELLPKPKYNRYAEETEFMEEYLNRCESIDASPELIQQAFDLACRYGLAAIDALHVAAALIGKAGEFVTSEKKDKPLFKVKGLIITSLHS